MKQVKHVKHNCTKITSTRYTFFHSSFPVFLRFSISDFYFFPDEIWKTSFCRFSHRFQYSLYKFTLSGALRNLLIIERFRNCSNKSNILQVKGRVQFSTRLFRFVFERRHERNVKNTAFGIRTTSLFALTVCTLKINSLELRTSSMTQFSKFSTFLRNYWIFNTVKYR